MTTERRPNNNGWKQMLIEGYSKRYYTEACVTEDDYRHISPIWIRKREARKKMDGYKCHSCGSPFNLVCHHTRYPEVWGEEIVDRDLITLCDNCHSKIHNKLPKEEK